MFHLVYAFKIIVKNTFQIDKSIEVYLCTNHKKMWLYSAKHSIKNDLQTLKHSFT